ncbi:MAG: carboxypeptidase regulatory-like domain-containing protein [Planctomycetaceae bacterium]|nr:carboxypeptidase regulatory-like domain-containing protein [Planctomycetaceae bacterium]MCA9110050.1 carboxypeptidase regulatory-like domain-containing protein [Planctomycetaceae bacterium]
MAVATVVFCFGCGRTDLPELAEVEGTVTLDGQPLEGVLVSFYPADEARPGTGVTDAEGHYELEYLYGEEGTKVGQSRVEVTTIWPDGEPNPGEVDRVPAQYQGRNSILSFNVQPDDNVFDIPMESGGANGGQN